MIGDMGKKSVITNKSGVQGLGFIIKTGILSAQNDAKPDAF